MQLDEIKLNSHYASHYIAEYNEGEDGDSVPIINKRLIRTSTLIEKLKNNITVKSDYMVDHLFPPNCRYYEQHRSGHLVVIEEPPAFRTITVDKDMSNEIESLKSIGKLKEYGYENWKKENPTRPYRFNLAMPYVTFILSFNQKYETLGGFVFFRTQPISGFADPFCKAPFLNINDSQVVCFGDSIYKGPKRSIFADTNHVISTFWSSIFNPDYIYNYHAYQEVAGLCDYLTWEYYSHTDPMFIYKADWIEAKDKNVGEVITRARHWILSREEDNQRHFSYNSLRELFDQQQEIGLEEVPGVGIKEPLIYDVCQYMYIGDTSIFVGDSFRNKSGKYCYIDSFLGFRKMSNPSFINVQNEDGKFFRMKLNLDTRNYVKERVLEERFESSVELANGVILRPGDILTMKNTYGIDIYRKIKYLRKTADGHIEGRFGSEFYIVNNLPEDIKILDLQNPEYKGIVLNKTDEYFIVRNANSNSVPHLSVAFCKFRGIDTSSRGNLVMAFEESQGNNIGHSYSINFSGTDQQKVFEINGLRELPPVFRVGKKLMYARVAGRQGDGTYEAGPAYVIDGHGVAAIHNSTMRDAPYRQFKNKLLVDDSLKIGGWDTDIEFKIGDKVVVANWTNPIEMLTVKRIEGFVENEDNAKISVLLSDKNKNQSTHIYVDGSSAQVMVGSMRKITNVWGELSAGMKIIAKDAGISMFPKKDCNIIIGFLYDTGGPEPLVLCSNGCTLWYSDVVEKFDKIPIKNKKWNTLTHSPINPAKMRVQAGDLINGKRYYTSPLGYLAYRPEDSRTIRALQVRYFSNYMESYSFDREFSRDVIFDSFPNPRLTSSQEEELGFVNAYPNFHGMFTTTDRYVSPYLFANEPRSILNVSDNSE